MTDTQFKECKNKNNIKDVIVPTGLAAVARKIELLSEDMFQQVLKDLSLQMLLFAIRQICGHDRHSTANGVCSNGF